MNIGSIGRKATGICLAALVTGALGGTALAQANKGPGPVLRALRGGLATLDLSQDQKDEIKGIFEAKKPGFETLRAKMKADATALHDAASAATPDTATVGAAFLKVRADREAAKASFESLLTEIKGVLTPDQQKKLEGYLAAMRQMRRGRHGGPATP
jgi:Spy/CpxP family protein refolding chaperone